MCGEGERIWIRAERAKDEASGAPMKDGILKAVSTDGSIRAVIAATTHLVAYARQKHQLSFTATAALGRALTAGLLLAPLLARDGQVALKFKGNGPLGKVMVDASPKGTVR